MKELKPKFKKIYLLLAALAMVALLGGFITSYALRTLPYLASRQNLTPAQEIAYKLAEKCNKTGEQCYSVEFGNLTKAEDLETSIEVLDEINKIDPQTRGCHLIAHSITTQETLKDIDKWKEILAKVPPDRCTGGFMHGIFEARQSKDPTFVISEETIPELCQIVKETQAGRDQDCAHIIGHLLVVIKEADLKAANEVCSNLPEELRYECHSGIYMENETRVGIVDHGLGKYIPWNKQTTETQQKLCEEVSGTEGKACWRELSHMYAFITKLSPLETYRLCQNAGNPEWIDDCYLHGVGIMVVSSGFNPNNFKNLCSPYASSDEAYATCMSWGIGSMLTSSPEFANMAVSFCKSVPFRLQENCFSRVALQLESIVGPEKLTQYCKDMPYPYKSRCENPYL